MSFIKYNSIDNHYNTKLLSKWTARFPALNQCVYVLQEKIHGSNFSVEFTPEGEVHLGKRSSRIGPHTKFYNVHNAWNNIKDTLAMLPGIASLYNGITLHGELFGGNVQKGVDYGKEQRILFFDIRYNGVLQSQKEFATFFENHLIDHLAVPNIAYVTGLEAALQHNETFDSFVLRKADNKAEGFVIKPYNHVYLWPETGSPFFLKKKSEAFKEKEKGKKKFINLDRSVSQEALLLKGEFLRYLNMNRLNNVISKLGPIETEKQIGKYIKTLLDDAKDDFIKENVSFDLLNSKEQRWVLNAGGTAAQLVKSTL